MVRLLIILFCFLLLQSCSCYKGASTVYGHPRKKIENSEEVNKSVFKVIDTLALYERVAHIQSGSWSRHDNSLGRGFFRFHTNGKFSSFIRMGYDSEEFKLFPDYKFSRKDFNPINSQMGYYYSQNNRIYSKRLTLNQCRVQVFENELFFKGDTIIEVNLKEKNSKNVYVKRQFPKEFLENWQPDW